MSKELKGVSPYGKIKSGRKTATEIMLQRKCPDKKAPDEYRNEVVGWLVENGYEGCAALLLRNKLKPKRPLVERFTRYWRNALYAGRKSAE